MKNDGWGWVDDDENFHSHDKRYGFEGPLPHYAMDAQRVRMVVIKEDASKIIFGGKTPLLLGDIILLEWH